MQKREFYHGREGIVKYARENGGSR
jgi:hypothetical protein